ncbi:hypothetical protein MACH08_14480 [Oceanobacillus kimchii]|uniref:Uncharacterized protein n=1 Tax=Oceanobacillus kimchii TaxID=746691 RepID=A0ABQ5TFK8_9BACI|nr:hypothetical protein MACH08_14480 [Oceanobacillus kimchii]
MRRRKNYFPFLFFILTVLAFFLNLLAMLEMMPIYFTAPLFIICIYLTLQSISKMNTSYR